MTNGATETDGPIGVEVLSFSKLFRDSPLPLAVDTYQRDFIWDDEKIRQLAHDLTDYQKSPAPSPPYYMGTVLVHCHREKNKRFIIDGQQRLTALCVLYYGLMGNLPAHCELAYSPKSARRIRSAARLFSASPNIPDSAVFEQIEFTVIWVDRADMAFTFFDTQNNRGVRLHATDLLKAYHLRAVNGATMDRKEDLQTLCAQRWEATQQGEPVMSHEQEFAPSLFSKFLWRARNWTASRVMRGGHDELMEEFQKQTTKSDGDHDTIPLYRSRHNRLGTALTFKRDGDFEIHTSRISLSPRADGLPFAIRQPIQAGIGFFLYAEKYAALLRRLVGPSVEVQRFREVYEKILMANSVFLREGFLLAALMYMDQFDDERLWEFSLWLEYSLGAIRVDKQQVRYETAKNFFKSDAATLNLLDVIAGGYCPQQVIAHLQRNQEQQGIYKKETIGSGKGVQGIYKQAVLSYYDRPGWPSLGDKHIWIHEKLKGGGM